MWTGEQPVDNALVTRGLSANQAIVARVKPLDVKLVSRFDTVPLPQFCRQTIWLPRGHRERIQPVGLLQIILNAVVEWRHRGDAELLGFRIR